MGIMFSLSIGVIMLKQAKIKLKNVSSVKVLDNADRKIVQFEGPDYVAQQAMELEDGFAYYGDNPAYPHLLYIRNVHYKDHTYDPNNHTATLELEETCNGKGIGIETLDNKRINGNYEEKFKHETRLDISQDENNRIVGKYISNDTDSFSDPHITAEFFLL